MKFYVKLIFCLFLISAYGQEKICQTKKENLEWINHLKSKKVLQDQLYLIKRKIYSDTLFCRDPKRIFLHNKRGDSMICKSIIVIESKEKHYNLDLQERPYLLSYINKLNNKNIYKVVILNDFDSAVYYGNKGLCGVVILKATEKFGRKIEKEYK
ncbi:hypothetical protein [Flavobacterium okayamense]|uniref:Uncharacterized protein n=1 Tax=Flavobacterium okayamense TaxID=2830782 RepID=A0ABN6HTJ0_9FLAO|nr:hypothetical protein [Flavobacterium okayamense]BCY27771.1 hypothetical protein KK2020170_06390 [Flavobacterium okayamense]